MLTALCLGFVLQAQATPITTATPPAPIVIASGPARPVVVVLDGQAVTLLTTPLAGTWPVPDPPAPPPKPPEPPVPTPITGVLWVSLVVQGGDVAQASLRTNADVRAISKANSINLRTYTHDDPALAAVLLTPYVAQQGTPLLVIQDQGGKVLNTIKPTDAASIVAEVRKYKP